MEYSQSVRRKRSIDKHHAFNYETQPWKYKTLKNFISRNNASFFYRNYSGTYFYYCYSNNQCLSSFYMCVWRVIFKRARRSSSFQTDMRDSTQITRRRVKLFDIFCESCCLKVDTVRRHNNITMTSKTMIRFRLDSIRWFDSIRTYVYVRF